MKMSNTIQRRIIMEDLCKLKCHPKADDLYEIVRTRLPRISLGTVYRNLDLMARAGEIWKLDIPGPEKRFDGNVIPHYHLRCTHCQAIEDIEIPDMEQIEKELAKKLDDRISAYYLNFTGSCTKCLKKHHASRGKKSH